MSKKKELSKIIDSNFNCSQKVFWTFAEDFGLDKETALKISTSFGGGMRKGEVCGAVTGALMALGLKHGHYVNDDSESKDRAYSLTKDFIKKFEERNQTIICKKILGYDISKENEAAIIKETGLTKTICPKVITDAVEILEKMIE